MRMSSRALRLRDQLLRDLLALDELAEAVERRSRAPSAPRDRSRRARARLAAGLDGDGIVVGAARRSSRAAPSLRRGGTGARRSAGSGRHRRSGRPRRARGRSSARRIVALVRGEHADRFVAVAERAERDGEALRALGVAGLDGGGPAQVLDGERRGLSSDAAARPASNAASPSSGVVMSGGAPRAGELG